MRKTLLTMDELEKRLRPPWRWWVINLIPPILAVIFFVVAGAMPGGWPALIGVVLGFVSARIINWDSSILFGDYHYVAGQYGPKHTLWVSTPMARMGEAQLLLEVLPPTVFWPAEIKVIRCGPPKFNPGWSPGKVEADGRLVVKSVKGDRVIGALSLAGLASSMLTQAYAEEDRSA